MKHFSFVLIFVLSLTFSMGFSSSQKDASNTEASSTDAPTPTKSKPIKSTLPPSKSVNTPDIDVDYNRDGTIDVGPVDSAGTTEDSCETIWNASEGAMLIVNCDSDDNSNPPYIENEELEDCDNLQPNGNDDWAKDFATFKTRIIQPTPATQEVTISIIGGASIPIRVNVYDSNKNVVIWTAGNPFLKDNQGNLVWMNWQNKSHKFQQGATQ